MNTSLKMILVLGLIAAISAGVLSGINLLTGPIIEEQAEIRLQETLAQVLEAEEFVEQEGSEYILWHAQDNGNLVGYVVRLLGQGYSSDGIDILVGLDSDAVVQGVYIFSHSETPGLGDKVAAADFLTQFEGKGLDDAIASGDDVDAISGATSSSMAVIGSVRNAVQFVGSYAGLVEEAPTIDFASIPDGVYAGTGRGFGGELSVEVTIEGGELTNVLVTQHGETAGISDPALSQIPDAMVESQSVEVDTVSGATMTSDGIISAVRDALAEFGGGEADAPIEISTLLPGKYVGAADGYKGEISIEVIVSAGKISEITVLSHTDTTDIADPAFDTVISNIVEDQSLEVDLVSGATFSSEGLIDAVKDALRSDVILDISSLADGEYSGEAEGFSGDPIQVTFVVEDGEIVSLEAQHSDTPDVANPAINELKDAIIDGQTLEVDLVSGATYTCQGLLDAIKKAIQNGPSLDVSTLPDGVFEGTGAGFMGDITVQVTVSAGEISDIEIVQENETPENLNMAKALLDAVMEEQTLEVDLVSGATGSSEGLLEAVEAALMSAVQ